MHHYRLGGWHLASEVQWPNLLPWPVSDERRADIVVRLGDVAPPTPPVRLERDRMTVGADHRIVFDVPALARFGMSGGHEVVIEPVPGAPWPDIQTCLFTPVLGAICHQRGLVPLHGAGLRTRAGAIAIVGHAGAGKSTTITALAQRGHRILGDDLLVVDPGTMRVQPSFPSVKLSSGSCAALSVDHSGLEPTMRGQDKWHVPVRQAFDPDTTHLTGVIHLQHDPRAARPRLTRLAPLQATVVIYAMVHRAYLSGQPGGQERVLATAARLARRLPAWQLSRTGDLADLPSLLGLIEDLVAADGLAGDQSPGG
ncbi:serine kinase (plasmid) [Tistrella bauzanensis]|uniref:HPr kinase/phosphorylase C-terminal domain-containing protein n=1 Tax=Tistrella arctica TaxID=3133430 RepID=A0ABU9YNX2_9PROT